MKKFLGLIVTVLMTAIFLTTPVFAEKEDVVILTLPFGTPAYMMDSTLEAFFSEVKDETQVNLKLKQVPGAMYMVKSMLKNEPIAKEGKSSYQSVQAYTAAIPYMREGRWPFVKSPTPNLAGFAGGPLLINTFVTFDPNIKTLKDLAGKKVGFAEKARVFQNIIPNKSYFDKAFGGYDKVNWQYLGAGNSKDALLNGTIDAVWAALSGRVELSETGEIICRLAVPSPPLLEMMSSGKKLYFLSEDAETINAAYDPAKDFRMQPIHMQKGAFKGLDKDFTTRGVQSCYVAWDHLSEDTVEDMIVTIYTNIDRLISYNKAFALFSKNPYPVGMPVEHAHPGLLKALKKLGMEIPKLK